MDELKYYSVGEVAKMLNLSTRAIYRFLASGELPAIKIGQGWRIANTDLAAFLSSREHN